MTDLSACPFCGCGVKAWLNDAHTRCDWLCGSFKHAAEPYQFPGGACRGNELELEADGWKGAHLHLSGDMLKVEGHIVALKAENARLARELADATKAGTPYWRERDAQNALVMQVASLEADIAALRGALGRIRDMCDTPSRCKCGRPTGVRAVFSCAQAALSRPGGDEYRAAKALADFILADFNETQVCPHCDPQEPDGHFEECPLDAYSKAKQEANPDGTP